jgi:Zn-dependent protease
MIVESTTTIPAIAATLAHQHFAEAARARIVPPQANPRTVRRRCKERFMQWSFRIGRLAGSEIRIHVTFFLLLLWIGIVHFRIGGSGAATEGITFVIAVFACVVLHELGHAVAARRYGIRTPRITLLPIGGVAELESMPEKPSEEIVVALAGPLVNVVIAAVLILVVGTSVDPDALASMEDPRVGFWARLAAVNIWLVLFNLIPAFPMDGGRVLRALLATRYSRVRATEIAISPQAPRPRRSVFRTPPVRLPSATR